MSPYPALAGLRIGCVKYLNSKPLIHEFPGPVVFDHPARLAEGMIAGNLDAALVPVFEGLGSRAYVFVDGVAIACQGPVYSVFLAYRGELKDVRQVVLDPASLTSVHLLKILLQEFHGLLPEYTREEPGSGGNPARLLIGNQAIAFRETAPADLKYLDLGEEWERQTGLPFVFALWIMKLDLPHPHDVADDFRQLKRNGLARLEKIIRAEEARGEAIAREYLTRYIKFDLGDQEKRAIALFRSLATKHGFLKEPLSSLIYL